MLINNQEFKQYKNTQYFINSKGDIYSQYSDTLLKPMLRKHGGNKVYRYIDIQDKETHKQKHTLVHRMVADTWLRPLQKGEQVNHINDDSLDNRVENLNIGTQKENIDDCYHNGHKISSIKYIIVKDKTCNKVLTFCPITKFIEYDGHPCANGSIKRWLSRKWFNARYEVIEFDKIKSLEHFKSVTTMADSQ